MSDREATPNEVLAAARELVAALDRDLEMFGSNGGLSQRTLDAHIRLSEALADAR